VLLELVECVVRRLSANFGSVAGARRREQQTFTPLWALPTAAALTSSARKRWLCDLRARLCQQYLETGR